MKIVFVAKYHDLSKTLINIITSRAMIFILWIARRFQLFNIHTPFYIQIVNILCIRFNLIKYIQMYKAYF